MSNETKNKIEELEKENHLLKERIKELEKQILKLEAKEQYIVYQPKPNEPIYLWKQWRTTSGNQNYHLD